MTRLFKQEFIYQTKYNDRFETDSIKEVTRQATEENINLSTSRDTLRFFRNIGSKQEVKRSYKNGKETVKIYSYEPHSNNTKRTVIKYTEI